MEKNTVIRAEYMAQLKDAPEVNGARFAAARENALKLIRDGRLMTAALYIYGRQLFMYAESLGEKVGAEEICAPMSGSLSPFPQGDGSVEWAPMVPVFWHCEPESAAQWRLGRPRERRRGRIALLKPEKLTEYVYHHFALTREGVFKGDKYMFISLYGSLLFSYFEEPRSSESTLRIDKESRAIVEWTATDPDSHFIHLPGSNGQNFLLLPAVFDVGESDAN